MLSNMKWTLQGQISHHIFRAILTPNTMWSEHNEDMICNNCLMGTCDRNYFLRNKTKFFRAIIFLAKWEPLPHIPLEIGISRNEGFSVQIHIVYLHTCSVLKYDVCLEMRWVLFSMVRKIKLLVLMKKSK